MLLESVMTETRKESARTCSPAIKNEQDKDRHSIASSIIVSASNSTMDGKEHLDLTGVDMLDDPKLLNDNLTTDDEKEGRHRRLISDSTDSTNEEFYLNSKMKVDIFRKVYPDDNDESGIMPVTTNKLYSKFTVEKEKNAKDIAKRFGGLICSDSSMVKTKTSVGNHVQIMTPRTPTVTIRIDEENRFIVKGRGDHQTQSNILSPLQRPRSLPSETTLSAAERERFRSERRRKLVERRIRRKNGELTAVCSAPGKIYPLRASRAEPWVPRPN